MKPTELKTWMAKNGKSPALVAAMARVSLKTVERYLAGEKVRPAMEAMIEKAMADLSSPERKAV